MGISNWCELMEETDLAETLFAGVVFVGAFSDLSEVMVHNQNLKIVRVENILGLKQYWVSEKTKDGGR